MIATHIALFAGVRLALSILICVSTAAAGGSMFGQQPPSSGAGTPSASPGADDLGTRANDPTAALKQLQFLNSYTPSYQGATGQGNSLALRPVLPARLLGLNTITRPTLQLNSAPNGRTGLGDTTLLSVAIFELSKGVKVGAGPILIGPSATNKFVGNGKWQLGPSVVAIDSQHKGLLIGVLGENPISFAGERGRKDVNLLLVQPIVVKTLSKGYFLRFDPTMVFDWQHGGASTLPLNGAVGRLLKLWQQPINAYVQAEWDARRPSYEGAVTPRFTLRISITLLYPAKGETR